MSVKRIGAEDVQHKKGLRLLKCPKCERWNQVRNQCLMQKIFVVTCKRCGTRYRPK